MAIKINEQTINAKLKALKAKLVAALTGKGVSVSAADTLDDMAGKVSLIITGGGGLDTSDATALPEHILNGETAYAKGLKVIGIMPNYGQIISTLTPANKGRYLLDGGDSGYVARDSFIGVDSTNKRIIPTEEAQDIFATTHFFDEIIVDPIPSSYVGSGVAKKTAQTYTPGVSNQTIAANQYLTGIQTITGDSNLASDNIKSGVSIFGVSGSYSAGGGIDTSDATVLAGEILSGKTAYARGNKITGTMANAGSANATLTPQSPSKTFAAGYTTGGTISVKAQTQPLTVTPTELNTTVTGGTSYLTSVEVEAIPLQYKDTSDATALPEHILSGETAYVQGSKITGAMHDYGTIWRFLTPTKPSMYLLEEDGLLGDSGYVAYDSLIAAQRTDTRVTPTEQEQIVQATTHFFDKVTVDAIPSAYIGSAVAKKTAQTYTPSIASQAIAANQYLTGIQTIQGDSNLVAANIKQGTSIFGVPGSYSGNSGLDTSDATALAGDILSGKTAYANGAKVVGSIPSKGAQTYTPGTANQTITANQYLSGIQTIQGNANLVATNIKQGVSIFGVTGNYTSDANAMASDIAQGKTAYVNGTKLTGTSTGTGGGIRSGIIFNEFTYNGTPYRIEIVGTERIAEQAFMQDEYMSWMYGYWLGVIEVVMDSGVTSIDAEAFKFMRNLETVVAPGVEDIYYEAFRDCDRLHTVYLPKIKNIHDAFNGCYNLNSITLGSPGNPVSSISGWAFASSSVSGITVYTAGGVHLQSEPWGADGATITYIAA